MDNLAVWVPESCTLPTVERPLRVAEFDELFADHLRGVVRVDATTLDLMLAADGRARAVELAARESECCSFFRFDVDDVADGEVRLRIGVPGAHIAVLDALSERARTAAGR